MYDDTDISVESMNQSIAISKLMVSTEQNRTINVCNNNLYKTAWYKENNNTTKPLPRINNKNKNYFHM